MLEFLFWAFIIMMALPVIGGGVVLWCYIICRFVYEQLKKLGLENE